MPRGNGTGPTGMGAMTGCGAGYCAGAGMPGFENRMPGRGFGIGFGRGSGFGGGRGWRRLVHNTGMTGRMRFGRSGFWHQNPSPEEEKQILKNQAEALQSELDLINRCLSEMEAS